MRRGGADPAAGEIEGEDAMREALRAARFGYAFLARHASALAILATWRIAVTLALLLAMDYAVPADAANLLAEAQLAGKYLALGLARTLLSAATLSAVALAWHRSAAGGQRLARWHLPTFTQGTGRYFLTVAGLALAAAAVLGAVLFGGNALGTQIALYLEVWQGPPSKFIFLAGTGLVLWALARLAPLLPQAALEDRRPSPRRAWARSRGHAAALLLLMLLCIVPAPLAMHILALYTGELAPALTLPAKALAKLAGILGILVFLAALTRYHVTRLQAAGNAG
jgi:hypothetical protein